MRKLITILLLFISVVVSSQNVWYVKPDGDNSKDGTSIANAWKTWGEAFNNTGIDPGDTVYFMDGVYTKDWTDPAGYYDYAYWQGYEINRGGTSGNPVHYFAYPGATPILDCDGTYQAGESHNVGVVAKAVNYVHIKGLHIRNVQQVENAQTDVLGIVMEGIGHILEQMVVYNIDGNGLKVRNKGSDTLKVLNCDVYNCCDSLGDQNRANPDPGQDGTGFSLWPQDDSSYVILSRGNRAWHCSDQGFSVANIGRTIIDSCWSFENGDGPFIDHYTVGTGDGLGMKLGWTRTYTRVTNSLMVNNEGAGIVTNENDNQDADSLLVYNNTFYNNMYAWRIEDWNDPGGNELHRIFKNNILYDNVTSEALELGNYTHSYNDELDLGGVTVSDADFLTLTKDSATVMSVLAASRKSGGYLPDIGNYYKLSSTSDLKDAGDDEGYGDDLGAFQYSAQVPAEAPNVTTGQAYNISTTGCIVIGNNNDSGGGTVTQKGVCWSTSENPTTADDKTEEGAGTGEFTSTITGLDEGTTYYVRAYATNEADTSYGDNVSFTTRKGGVIIGGDGNVTFIKGKIYIKK